MDARRPFCALFLVGALVAVGCETTSDDGPTPVCDDVAGVWDVTLVGESGTGISCPDRTVVWSVGQDACVVSLTPGTWDATTSASGGITENHLYVEWTWYEGCYRYTEIIDVTVDGDTMTGTYYLARGQAVYPAYCPGLGLCSAAVDGARRSAP